MRALLDVSFLIALFDANHVSHRPAREWLQANIDAGWSSCAITQNGYVRIVSQPRYPNRLTPEVAIRKLERACETRHHTFRTSDVTLTDSRTVHRERILGPGQVTDAYLLALAVHHGDRLVTLDHRIVRESVPDATPDHLVLV